MPVEPDCRRLAPFPRWRSGRWPRPALTSPPTSRGRSSATCPLFPGGKRRLHWSLADPSKATGSEAEQLAVYRSVRDAIRARIADELVAPGPAGGGNG
jgi:hypothetical protein